MSSGSQMLDQDIFVPLDAEASTKGTENGMLAEIQPKRQKTAIIGKETAARLKKLDDHGGLLQLLLEAPVDIVYEIFSFLDPYDMIRLSRTSKELRRVLLQQSSAFLWRQARDNIDGLPAPPADLSETQYANLVFDFHCQKCLSYDFTETFWSCRIRCCNKCAGKLFQEIDHSEPYGNTVPEDLNKVLPALPEIRRRLKLTRFVNEYYIPAVDQALLQYHELQSQAMRDDWLEQKQQQKKAIKEWATQTSLWAGFRVAGQSESAAETKHRRFRRIVQKLMELGLGEELALLDESELQKHHLVDEAKDLNPRTWSNIKPELVKWIEERQAERKEEHGTVASS
ncbi:hypothetical protein C8J56DRAFT_168400 [Mycena floridula]|nr:hypothetical protein C8J56DRAFT_168400 [Mycena floridula]